MLSVLNQFLSQPFYSVEEYIAFEEKTEVRHEYHNGKLRPMSGGSRRHSSIIGQITYLLIKEFIEQSNDCVAMPNDMRVFVKSRNKGLYPDVVVCCGKEEYTFPDRTDFVSNPTALFEVLSPSTEAYDLSEKFDIYQELDTLKEYVIVHQSHCHVEVRSLIDAEKNSWKLSFYKNLTDVVRLNSLGVELPLSVIYRNIIFDKDVTDDEETLI